MCIVDDYYCRICKKPIGDNAEEIIAHLDKHITQMLDAFDEVDAMLDKAGEKPTDIQGFISIYL
ncbi:MAG: hypothetical protein ACFFBD_21590 [Candidatus Hodarchaeota archaeon]